MTLFPLFQTQNDKQLATRKICTEVKKENNGKPDIIDIECCKCSCEIKVRLTNTSFHFTLIGHMVCLSCRVRC